MLSLLFPQSRGFLFFHMSYRQLDCVLLLASLFPVNSASQLIFLISLTSREYLTSYFVGFRRKNSKSCVVLQNPHSYNFSLLLNCIARCGVFLMQNNCCKLQICKCKGRKLCCYWKPLKTKLNDLLHCRNEEKNLYARS